MTVTVTYEPRCESHAEGYVEHANEVEPRCARRSGHSGVHIYIHRFDEARKGVWADRVRHVEIDDVEPFPGAWEAEAADEIAAEAGMSARAAGYCDEQVREAAHAAINPADMPNA